MPLACTYGDEGDDRISLTIKWTRCRELVRDGAGFGIGVDRGYDLDGGFEDHRCEEGPMEFGLPEGDRYRIDVEGRGSRIYTFDELQELDFNITW